MRSPLQWWLDRRACRRWERGPARMPTNAELVELRELTAVQRARRVVTMNRCVRHGIEGPTLHGRLYCRACQHELMRAPVQRPSELEASGGDVEEYLIWLEQRWERR